MYNKDLFIGREDLTVLEAMQKIDINSKGILFISDSDGRLLGSVTDGDIRRYLVSGGSTSDLVFSAANKCPRVANSISEAEKLYHPRFYHVIPVVDNDRIITDFYYIDNEQKLILKNKIDIPVVINAGGKGRRLDPYTRVLPKPLIPVGDLPIIELIMKEYQSYHCNDFHIILNYKKDLVKAYFNDNESGYNISWYDEDEPLGTGGGLRFLRGKLDSTFFFANCDVLLTADLESIVNYHYENKNVITMICANKTIHIPYGVVEKNSEGTIECMREKPLISFLANTGIYIVEPEVIEDIMDDEMIGFPDIVEREKQKGKRVAVYSVSENDWMDMGQLPELEKMRKRLE